MSTVDPALLPKEVGDALVRLIGICAKHDMPIGKLLEAPDVRRLAQLEFEKRSLLDSLAKATLTIIKLRKQIADYEEI